MKQLTQKQYDKKNEQLIFDYVIDFMREQGQCSVTHKGHCMYRTSDGLRCAVGCLLENHEYKWDMECATVYILNSRGDLPKPFIPYVNLLLALQEWHDYSFGNSSVLKTIAYNFDLVYKSSFNRPF